jgi:hypothetical protein
VRPLPVQHHQLPRPGPGYFPARPADGQTETAPVPGVNLEADNDSHTLAISGQWWFRGVYSVIPQGRDALLRYHRFSARLPGPSGMQNLVWGAHSEKTSGTCQHVTQTRRTVGRSGHAGVRRCSRCRRDGSAENARFCR